MKPRVLLAFLALFALVAAACGGSESSDGSGGTTSSGGPGGGAAGAECSTGQPCDPTNDCLVKDQAMFTSPQTGVCTPRTGACQEGCQCVPAACLKSPLCFATGRGASQQRLFGCVTTLRAENEACELGLGCQDGLYCLVPNEGEPGTCKKIPDGCSAETFCSQCPTMKAQCTPGTWKSCTSLSVVPLVECRL